MTSGYSGTPLARKLGIREGHRVATLHAPAHFPDLVGTLPAGVRIEADPPLPETFVRDDEDAAYDVVIGFVPEPEALAPRLTHGHRLLSWSGGLWISWPKQSSALATELRETHVREAGLRAGLVDNKICAVDEDWSGLRFVYRREDRPGR